MSSNATEIVKAIKRAAIDANDATKPVNVHYGEVTSVSPLEINVEQKMVLGSAQLVLSRNVTEHTIDMTVDHSTESALDIEVDSIEMIHNHGYKGKKTFTVHNGLAVGDTVILLRQQEGQKYFVLDRIGK